MQPVRYSRHLLFTVDSAPAIEPHALWDGDRRHYIGYDSNGLAIGRLSLDYADRIMEIGDGTALLLNVAEHGVETIRLARYRF